MSQQNEIAVVSTVDVHNRFRDCAIKIEESHLFFGARVRATRYFSTVESRFVGVIGPQ